MILYNKYSAWASSDGVIVLSAFLKKGEKNWISYYQLVYSTISFHEIKETVLKIVMMYLAYGTEIIMAYNINTKRNPKLSFTTMSKECICEYIGYNGRLIILFLF